MNIRVVCAAIRNQHGMIICGARHFDGVMRRAIEVYKLDSTDSKWEQGFINQYGNFMTREQAYECALANGQIINDCSPGSKKLFSENLY